MMVKKKGPPGGKAKAGTNTGPLNHILPADASQADVGKHILTAVNQLRCVRGQVTEIRALNVPREYGKPCTVAGWFDDPSALTASVIELESRRPPGIYMTLNPVSPALLARAHNRMIDYPKATASDHDIIKRVWLPIDLDPVRSSGVSATPKEIENARLRAVDVETFLAKELGEPPGLRGFSGNGWHLLYRTDLPNDEKSTAFVRHLIEVVADRFSDNVVTIDRSVFNAGRIWKLYGTLARKGDEVPRLGRVHRRSALVASFERVRVSW